MTLARDRIDLERNREGVEVATYSDDTGTPELAQHKPVTTETTNEAGETRTVRRTQDLLDGLHKRDTITTQQFEAGRKFERLFHRAALNPTASVSLEGRSGGQGSLHMSEAVVQARECVDQAMRSLGGHGSPAGNAAWHVLGNGMSIKDWARRERFGGLQSSMNERTAAGVLIAALGVLARHWGM